MISRKLRIGTSALTAFATMGLLSTNTVQAQGAALEEIVVTSRKIEERLQDVPLAITAFNAEELESSGIDNLDDVANMTPGLTFSNLLGEFLPVPVIRGIAPTAVQDRENNAAIFVDGVFISGRQGLNFAQLDVERIEVVKGPQAAMYGRNSFSGAVNIITAKPTDEFQGKAEMTIGDNDRRTIMGSVGGPLIEGVLGARVALMKNEWGGSYENQVAGGPDIGGYDYETFQGSLVWTPTDQFEAMLTAYVSNDQIDMSATSAHPMNCENSSATGVRLENFCGELPSVSENSLSVINRSTGEDRDVVRGSLNLELETDAGTFTALSGFSKVQQSFFVDGARGDPTMTMAYQTFFGAPGGPSVLDTFEAEFLQIGPGSESEEFSQELRFTSLQDRSVRYTVGAYLYGVESEERDSGVDALTDTPFGFLHFCPCIELGPPGTNFGFAPTIFPGGPSIGDLPFGPWFAGPGGSTNGIVDARLETDAWAVFGAIEADFSDRLTGRVELRYTDEEKSLQEPGTGIDLNNSWDFITWRATLDFKPTDNTLFYGSVASAEKSGDFDFATETNINDVDVTLVSFIDPDQNTSFELGTKGTYLDGRLRSDIAVFFIDWTDLVIPQLVQVDPNGVPLTGTLSLDMNAGDATVLGLEASFDYAFTDNLTGNLGFTVTNPEFGDAKIEGFAAFPSFAPDGQVKGNKLLRQSDVQANATFKYQREWRGETDWFIRGDVMYTGEQFMGSPNQAIVPAHTYVNLRLGLDSARYTVELWAENLFDDDNPVAGFRDVYFSNTGPGGGVGGFFDTFFPFRITLSHPRRRQVGIMGRVRF
jgi:iron complex outermembrane receptor protein